jgi:hypothetical protein
MMMNSLILLLHSWLPSVKIANDRREKADERFIRVAQRLDVVRFTEDLVADDCFF